MLRADLERALQRVIDAVVGRLEAEHQQRMLAVSRHRQPRLAPIDEPAVGRVQSRLAYRAHAIRAVGEARKADSHRATVGRPWLNADPRLRDHAERALRARQHPVGARTRARPRQPPRRPHARRRDRPHGLDEVLDVGAHRREVTRRARRDPAPEGRELERLREVAERHRVRAQPRLEHGARRSGLDARGARELVDLQHAVHCPQVHRDGAVVAVRDLRRDASDDRGPAAVGDRGHALARAPFEHPLNVLLIARKRDEVGRMFEFAAKAAHHVHVGLSQRVRRARVVVIRGYLRQRARHADAGSAQLQGLQRSGLLELTDHDRDLIQALGQRARALAQLLDRRPLVLIAPPPVLGSARRHRQRVYAHAACH